MKLWKLKIGLLLFLLYFNSTFGQNKELTDLNLVASLLRGELGKSGHSTPDIHFNRTPNGPGIHLSLLKKEEHDRHNLFSQPADAFYIRATDRSLNILAASVNGLRNGVYWYLHFLGFRYYFPERSWHVVPRISSIYKPVEKTVFPSYTSRRIWYAYGTGSKMADADFKLWSEANLQGGETINAGHSYEAIVIRNKEVFLKHPEFFAQNVKKGSIPPNPKFEVGNEALVQLCINDAFRQIETHQKKTGNLPTMISMDPSDGGGFSIKEASTKIGGPSEQTFYLANKVAKAIREKYPSVKVGLYAYNYHSAPPKFPLEPNIVVLIATAYNQSVYSTDQLIDLWEKKGVKLGIRDYFGVLAWDWDMPGQVKGSRTSYVKQIRDYYKKGIRLFSAETNTGWISRGLGHYIAARLLWDVNSDIEAIKAEFFPTMFGKAAPHILKLFDSWEKYRPAVPLEGDIQEWIILVETAEAAENNKQVRERLKQIKEYLYYIHLFRRWREEAGDDNLVSLLNFAYRVQEKSVLSSYPLFRTLANSAVKGKQNMRFNDPNAKWKLNNTPVGQAEINEKIRSLRQSLDPKKKTVVTEWPEKFNPVINEPNQTTKETLPIKLRGVHKVIFSKVGNENASINLSVGYIKAHNFKPLSLRVYKYNQSFIADEKSLVLQKIIQPRQPDESISLSSLKPGDYFAIIDDARGGFKMSFSGNIDYGIVADNQNLVWTLNRSNLFFEIKKGTKEFVLKTDGVLTLVSPKGRKIDLQKKDLSASILRVEDGEEGFWEMRNQSGRFWIQGMLPVISTEKKSLLRYID